MRLYVGNLSFKVTDEELREAFAPFGEVVSATVVRDKFTDQPRGFAFVEMATDDQGKAAITGVNGQMIGNRAVEVAEARPRDRGTGGGGGGGFRRGGGGGGGRGHGDGGGNRW